MSTAVVAIRKFPTRLHVICGGCGHQGFASVFLEKPPKLKCRKCGGRDAIIANRDRLRVWSRQRRGR